MKWELRFLDWADRRWDSRILDRLIPWLTHLGSHVAVLLFLFLNWGWTKRISVFYAVLLAYAISSFLVYALKYLVRRKRPPLSPTAASKISRGPGEILDPSFPSAHAANAFMMATLLSVWFPQFQIVFFFVAAFVGWTRIYLGLHYPTDVFAGAVVGYGITKIVLKFVIELV